MLPGSPMQLFNSAAPNQAPPQNAAGQNNLQQQQTPANQQPRAGTTQTPNANINGDGRTTENTGTPATPVDKYKDLWDTSSSDTGNTPDPNNQQQQSQPQNPPAKKGEVNFVDVAKKINFAQTLNPELVSKALGGDVAAFQECLNSGLRAAFAASAKMSHQMSQRQIAEARDGIFSELPQHMKKHTLQNTSFGDERFNHPAIKPMLDAVRAQMAVKYPQATDAELTEQAKEYMKLSMGAAFGLEEPQKAPGKPGIIAGSTPGEESNFDWNNYLSGGAGQVT